MVVHGLDGLDELSTIGKTKVSELRDGRVSTRVIEPQELGLEPAAPSDIAGGDSAENARVIVQILRGERGPRRDIVLLNAAAAIYVSGLVDDLEEGLELARKSIDSGLAYRKLREFIQATGGDLARVDLLEEKHEHS
jgi:anthranilate phosphoribosyltransferase